MVRFIVVILCLTAILPDQAFAAGATGIMAARYGLSRGRYRPVIVQSPGLFKGGQVAHGAGVPAPLQIAPATPLIVPPRALLRSH
jgi:hypothetical protein